jgi:hypothetical protein
MGKSRKRRGAKGTTTLQPLASLEMGPPEVQRITGKVFKTSWADPEDMRPNAREARTVTGHRAYCPLRWCRKRHGDRSAFTVEHIEAADRLRAAWDGARLGFAGLKDWRPISSIQYRPSTGPGTAARRQLGCRKAFDKAWALFDDRSRALLASVVLMNLSIAQTSETLSITKALASQRLAESLAMLVRHFDLGERRRAA